MNEKEAEYIVEGGFEIPEFINIGFWISYTLVLILCIFGQGLPHSWLVYIRNLSFCFCYLFIGFSVGFIQSIVEAKFHLVRTKSTKLNYGTYVSYSFAYHFVSERRQAYFWFFVIFFGLALYQSYYFFDWERFG